MSKIVIKIDNTANNKKYYDKQIVDKHRRLLVEEEIMITEHLVAKIKKEVEKS